MPSSNNFKSSRLMVTLDESLPGEFFGCQDPISTLRKALAQQS